MNIRVEEIRKLERGSLRGFATVNIAGFIRISHIEIIQPEGKEAFIQMPQRSYQTNNGERRYDVIDLPDDLTREIEKAILWFWESGTAHLASGGARRAQGIADGLYWTLHRRRGARNETGGIPARLRIFFPAIVNGVRAANIESSAFLV
jgi:hypothetical protein